MDEQLCVKSLDLKWIELVLNILKHHICQYYALFRLPHIFKVHSGSHLNAAGLHDISRRASSEPGSVKAALYTGDLCGSLDLGVVSL